MVRQISEAGGLTGRAVKNKQGREVWFEQVYPVGLTPVTLKGVATLLAMVLVPLALGYGANQLFRMDRPLLGLLAGVTIPVVVIWALVLMVRHVGPRGSTW